MLRASGVFADFYGHDESRSRWRIDVQLELAAFAEETGDIGTVQKHLLEAWKIEEIQRRRRNGASHCYYR